MHALDETDRTAVLLRFFENKSLREVGAVFGLSDDAAQKRVSRAVERLREFFTKQGVNVGASGLIVAVSANAVQAAPIGLAGTISTALLMGTITTATVATQTALTAMNWINAKSVAAIVASALLAGTGAYLVPQREANRLRKEKEILLVQHDALVSERDAALGTVGAQNRQLEGLQKDQTELLRLRNEVGLLRQQVQAQKAQASAQQSKPKAEAAPMTAHAPGTYIPKDQLGDFGYATPEAAIETHTWKMLNGTYEQVNEGLGPEMLAAELNDPKGREKSEKGKAQLVPLFNGMQILAKKVLADDKVEIKFTWALAQPGAQIPNARTSQLIIQPMTKIGEQWKIGDSSMQYEKKWEKNGQIQTFVP